MPNIKYVLFHISFRIVSFSFSISAIVVGNSVSAACNLKYQQMWSEHPLDWNGDPINKTIFFLVFAKSKDD